MYLADLQEHFICDIMVYDSFNYDIKSRLPLWWQEDTFLEPINRYAQELLKDLVGGFLTNLGVVQPVQVWKTLPTEYSWLHTYISHDSLLKNEQGGTVAKILYPNTPIRAEIPNSKRNSHAIIQLKLTGDYHGAEKKINKLIIRNAHQTITINNITTMTDIKIFTEDHKILIDGVQRSDLVTGYFDKIYSQAKNTNYEELDIRDENKITYIELESDVNTMFDLKIKHIHPIYVTEQNIRVYSVSAFPIEYIKLYGFYCHDFNNKQEWQFLWEKHYDEEDRVVFDRITKQFDCETFYVQVKLHGIGVPLVYGFPQEELSGNSIFETNKMLDKWGRIYGLPRRYYKTHISDDDEPYTFPPYYKYNIEQDYWYEQRLINEYQHNEDAINAAYIKDDQFNNIALLRTIDPFIEDIYVYTETISPDIDYNREIGYINPTYLLESGEGITWANPHQIANTTFVGAEIELKPKTSQYFNTKEYQTKILEIHFDEIPELPKNIEITGIELKITGMTDIHSTSLTLDDRTRMLLPIINTIDKEVILDIDSIPIVNEEHYWEKGKGVYSIGGKNILFGQEKITKEQIQNGLAFELAFTNNNQFLKTSIVIYNIQLFIYYKLLQDKYDMNVELDKKEIILTDNNKQRIKMKINLENTGNIPVVDKTVFIVAPPELHVTHKKFGMFDLDVKEKFIIGDTEDDEIIITCPDNRTGFYDIMVFCDDKVVNNQITVRNGFE